MIVYYHYYYYHCCCWCSYYTHPHLHSPRMGLPKTS